MPGDEGLRVPPVPSAEKTELGRSALQKMRASSKIYELLLTVLGDQLPEPVRETHEQAVKGLMKQLEHLYAGFEIVLGPREPSAAERAGRK